MFYFEQRNQYRASELESQSAMSYQILAIKLNNELTSNLHGTELGYDFSRLHRERLDAPTHQSLAGENF